MSGSRRFRQRRQLLAALPLAACAAGARADDAQPVVRSFRVTTDDGVRLNVLESGPPQADPALPVIVLVPGWCMPASIWQPQLRSLGQRYRTLALDPRGQGDSDAPATGYEPERRARDLQQMLAPLPRALLVGWSLGVLDALNLVDLFGDARLAGLVLVDNSVGEPPAPKPSNFVADLRADRSGTLDRFVHAMFAHPRPEAEMLAIKQAALKMPLDGAVALLSYPYPREHWRRIARAFAKPLCYCVTSQFLAQARNLKRERPATRVEWFEHAGHALFVDEPARFNRIVDEFAQSA